ncbi:hypothetical protein DFH06DRAFT_1066711 [Mycena polygramma]|nr:hypothetical protein DFH06DRAFT_1066711 [Mycena polygramma]
MTSSSPDFPPELHDLVIDHMHRDKGALANCGLVSKSWLRSSRHHLFDSVALRNRNWKAFLQLLGSPLATFPGSVKSLTISVSDYATMEPSASFNRLIHELRGSNASKDPPRVLSDLNLLRLDGIHWSDVTQTTTLALVELCPYIRELDLRLVTFDTPYQMAALVSHFPRTQKLSMSPFFSLYESPLQYPDIPRSIQHIRLRLDGTTRGRFNQIAHWIHAGDGPPSIRALEIGIVDVESLASFAGLLRALGPVLQDLDLGVMYHVTADDIRARMDLSKNLNLRSLTIHISLRRFQRAPSLHAPWGILAAAHSSSIDTLTIVLSIDVPELLANLDWAHLTNALKTYPQFAAMRRLHFMVHCFTAMVTDDTEGAIRARVPEFDERGIVEVSLLHTSRVFTHGEYFHPL